MELKAITMSKTHILLHSLFFLKPNSSLRLMVYISKCLSKSCVLLSVGTGVGMYFSGDLHVFLKTRSESWPMSTLK